MSEPDLVAGRRFRRQVMLAVVVVLALFAAWVVLRDEPAPTSRYGSAYRVLCHAYEEATADRRGAARRSYVDDVQTVVAALAEEVEASNPRITADLRSKQLAVETALTRTDSDLEQALAELADAVPPAMAAAGDPPPPTCRSGR